jgi:hypothetical protein
MDAAAGCTRRRKKIRQPGVLAGFGRGRGVKHVDREGSDRGTQDPRTVEKKLEVSVPPAYGRQSLREMRRFAFGA